MCSDGIESRDDDCDDCDKGGDVSDQEDKHGGGGGKKAQILPTAFTTDSVQFFSKFLDLNY